MAESASTKAGHVNNLTFGHVRGKNAGVAAIFRREKRKMSVIALVLVIAAGVWYGVVGSKGTKRRAFSVEDYQMMRERCYKLAELREKPNTRKASASELLIYGVLKQGVKSLEKYPVMKGGE